MGKTSVLEAILGEAQDVVVFQPAFGPDRLGSPNARTWRRLAGDAKQDIRPMSQMAQCKAVLPPELESRLISTAESDPSFKHHSLLRDDCGKLRVHTNLQSALNFESRKDLIHFLCERLIRYTVLSSARSAVRTLGDLLELGSKNQIPGFEVSFIVGISSVDDSNRLEGPYRWLPYSSIRDLAADFSRPFLDWQTHDWSARHKGPVSALVREFRWGPLIARDEEEWPKCPSFECIAVDMLSHVLKVSLRPVGVTHLVAREIMDLLGDSGTGMSFPWPEQGESKLIVSREKWERFGALLDSSGKIPDERTSKRIGIATSRLASATRRGGPLEEQDRTMDVAIALEALLGRGGMSVAESLASRAAWFLGVNANERQHIRRTVKRFYSLRSDLVHGRKP